MVRLEKKKNLQKGDAAKLNRRKLIGGEGEESTFLGEPMNGQLLRGKRKKGA